MIFEFWGIVVFVFLVFITIYNTVKLFSSQKNLNKTAKKMLEASFTCRKTHGRYKSYKILYRQAVALRLSEQHMEDLEKEKQKIESDYVNAAERYNNYIGIHNFYKKETNRYTKNFLISILLMSTTLACAIILTL